MSNKKKEVLVETVDGQLFEIVMTKVVKCQNNEYCIFMKDICELLSLAVRDVNKSLTMDYTMLREQDIPHLELPQLSEKTPCNYVEGGKEYKYEEDDMYFIKGSDTEALSFAFLSLIRDSSIPTDFDEIFAVNLSTVVGDCFRYAPQFEYTK